MNHNRTNATNSHTGRKFKVLLPKTVAILSFGLAAAVPDLTLAQAYPNGASTNGVITATMTYNGMLRFIVQGTLDDGSTGQQAFWIDTTATGGSQRVANILSAAALGKNVSIWNTGNVYSYGGQTGYWSLVETTNY